MNQVSYKTSFKANEGPTDGKHFKPFISFNPQEGPTDYDGAEILLTFAEGTLFAKVEEISSLLDGRVKTVQVTRHSPPVEKQIIPEGDGASIWAK